MLSINKLPVFAIIVSIAFSVGCRQQPPAATPKDEGKAADGPLLAPPKQQAEPAPKDDHAAAPVETNKSGSDRPATNDETAKAAKIKANLASLSAPDRALAEKQKICPVSGELLGSMDVPEKLHVAGHDVFICCPGCEEDIKNQPAKYLAKIGLKPAK
ncbi:MAG TPA: hypothetical protein VFW73_01665 [Lacipirellulaceae bacterium]|nr:hypothetical protein [Lacipirellulaceae bacterium]